MASPLPTPAPFRAAAIQFEPVFGDKGRNVAELLRLTEEAARFGARLIVHPEMATTGYCWADRAEIAPHVEPIPGPTTERFAALAAEHGCHVVVCLPEVATASGIFYNSAALIGPRGLIGVYRKTHAYISEPKWAKDGDLGLPVFETELGRIAIAICQDFEFFETARVPVLRGADVVCFPTNWLGDKSPSATWLARALENGVYVLAANRYGLERGVQFSGGSCVIGPYGNILASHDTGDRIVYADVDVSRARDKRRGPDEPTDLLKERRPDAYGNLTLNTYLWEPGRFHSLYGLRPLPDGRRSRVVVAQFAPQPGDVAANLDRIAALVARHAGADLLVLPELAITGSVRVAPAPRSGSAARGEQALTAREQEISRLVARGWADREIAESLSINRRMATTHVSNLLSKLGSAPARAGDPSSTSAPTSAAAWARLAESIPGSATGRLEEIAGREVKYVVASLVERDGERLFNSAVLVGPDGLIGVYRKLHLATEDRDWATPGDRGLPTFDTPIGRIGLLIGSDVWFPEAARCLALDGADLIAWPSLVTSPAVQPAGATTVPLAPPVDTGPTPAHVHLWRQRARENNTYVAFANGATPAMGWSGVFGPAGDTADGESLVRGANEGSAALTIDTATTELWGTRAKGNLGLRIPIWYDDLQVPTDST